LKEIQHRLRIFPTSVFTSVLLLPFTVRALLELEEAPLRTKFFVFLPNHLPNEVFRDLFEDPGIQKQNSSMKNKVFCGITLSLRLGIKVSEKHDESQWF